MKLKTLLSLILIIGAALTIYICFSRISALKDENEKLQNNQAVLLSEKNAIIAESRRYKVADSLSALKVAELRLTLEEYKKYRASDLALIRKLKLDKRDMQKVIDTQAETISSLSTQLRDTIIIRDDALAKLKTFSYKSEWTDVNGLIDLATSKIDLTIRNRESLVLVESVEYKRFLGFLWKTTKVKSRSIDIVSRNPNTEIIDAKYERIEK
jgi:hypothetical protein